MSDERELQPVAEGTVCIWEKPGKCPDGHKLVARTCWQSEARPGWTVYYCSVNVCRYYIGSNRKQKRS